MPGSALILTRGEAAELLGISPSPSIIGFGKALSRNLLKSRNDGVGQRLRGLCQASQ